MKTAIKKNPWIAKSIGNFDIAKSLQLLLMGYGVFCIINKVKNIFTKPVRHSGNND